MKGLSALAIILSLASLFPFLGAVADPIGEVHIAGNTWCELQWDGSIEKMIALDTVDNTVYVVWTYAPAPPYSYYRQSYFNKFDPESGWVYEEPGCHILPEIGGQINHTILLPESSRGIDNIEIGFELDDINRTTRVWWQDDRFYSMPLDTLWDPIERLVRKAYGRNGYFHVVGEGFQDIHLKELWYGRYRVNPFEFGGWEFVDTLTHFTYDVAASPVSDRVAIVYQKQKDFSGPEYYYDFDSDFYLVDSYDGIEWDWQDRFDITSFEADDLFRPSFDVDMIIDYNDQVHLTFSSQETHINPNFPESTFVNGYMTYIWHWSEATDSFSVATDGWIHDPPPQWECYFGNFMQPVGKPQMGIDPYSRYLYILYERNNCDDCSQGPKHPNTDLSVSVSTDNGLNWSTGTNITDTHTPDCLYCECASEIQASINTIVNDTLHIVYILDSNAGIYQYDDGFLCESKIVYQKIPANFIPTEPLIPQFSIRTGPPTDIKDVSAAPIPRGLLISGNYPNPFNATTIISYYIPEAGRVNLSIYDLMGREAETLIDGQIDAGNHRVVWDASRYPSGIYFASLSAGDGIKTAKMTVLR